MSIKKLTSTIVAFIVAATTVLFLFCPTLHGPAMAAVGKGNCADAFSSVSAAAANTGCMGTHTALLNNIVSTLPENTLFILAALVFAAALTVLFKKILNIELGLLAASLYTRFKNYLAYHKPILQTKFTRWLALLQKRDFALVA